MRMGELESSSGSVGVRRSGRLINKRSNDLLKVIDVDDDDDLEEVVEEEEDWEPGTGRKGARKGARKGIERRTKRGEKGTGVTSTKQEEVDGKLNEVYWSGIVGIEYEEKTSAKRGEKGTGVTSTKQEEVDGKLNEVYWSGIVGIEYEEKTSAKRGEKGTGVTSTKQEEVDGKLNEVSWSGIVGIEYEEKTSAMIGFDAVDVVSHELGLVNLSKDVVGNSRATEILLNAVNAVKSSVQDHKGNLAAEEIAFVRSLVEDKGESRAKELILNAVRSFLQDTLGNSPSTGIVLNAVAQELVVVDPSKEGIMERSFVRTVSPRDPVVILSSSGSSDDGAEGDNSTDYESPGEEEEIDTTLSREDAALFGEVTKVLQEGGDLKKLKIDHLKAYLRRHGLRMSGVKAVLLSRIEDHLKFKDGQVIDIYPRSSFSIHCKGDVCLGDTVLFLQNVYDSFDLVSRSAEPLGKRWVAGKVVNESYGAEKQQHTFTIEVLWSTGTRPFYLMRPLQIKGRNLYRTTTRRQPWINEAERQKVLDEKHARGAEARAQRRAATALSLRGRSRSRPGSRGHSYQGGESRSILPTIPPSHNSMQHGRIHTQQINVHQGSTAAHSHTRNRPAESERIPPTIPPFQNSMQHGRAHTEQHGRAHPEHHGRAHPEHHGRAHPEHHGRAHPEHHGRTHTEHHVYRGSTGAQGISHICCSNLGCEKAGAKHCITRSCASCCMRNGSTRGSCPRHQ